MRLWFLLVVCAGLAACGDPLASVDRLSEVELAEDDPMAQALPTEEEVAREGFFGTTAADPDAPPSEAPAAEAPRRGGLLGLFRRQPEAPEAQPTAPVVQDTTETPAEAAQTEAQTGEVQLAGLPPETAAPQRGGLLGLFAPRGTGSTETASAPESALPEVPYGTVIPYGEVARSCDARGRNLGSKIENAPARGYRLYDSAPGTAGLRTYYITGFPDGCPRQITAANVLLGAPSLYEKLHYGPTGAHLASGETDAAYERVKRKICGKSKGRPCGGKIGEMDRTTFFITSYPRLGSTPRWSEVLIHKGEVMASGFKSAG